MRRILEVIACVGFWYTLTTVAYFGDTLNTLHKTREMSQFQLDVYDQITKYTSIAKLYPDTIGVCSAYAVYHDKDITDCFKIID